MGKVKEPASTYYSRPMLNALRNHIKDRIEQMDDAVLLSKISSMLDKDEESFEERYQRAKEFAYTHLDRYNPQIQISAESGTKRSNFRQKDKTKRSKKGCTQHL